MGKQVFDKCAPKILEKVEKRAILVSHVPILALPPPAQPCTCRKTPPFEIFSWLANSLAICEFAVDSWIPRPLVEFLGPQSILVGPKTVTHGRPCSRSARKFWCCPRLRKCSRYCMQGWTTLGYRRKLGNCARKLCSEIQKTGCLPWVPAILHARFATSVGSGRCLEFAQKNLGGGLACKV